MTATGWISYEHTISIPQDVYVGSKEAVPGELGHTFLNRSAGRGQEREKNLFNPYTYFIR